MTVGWRVVGGPDFISNRAAYGKYTAFRVTNHDIDAYRVAFDPISAGLLHAFKWILRVWETIIVLAYQLGFYRSYEDVNYRAIQWGWTIHCRKTLRERHERYERWGSLSHEFNVDNALFADDPQCKAALVAFLEE